MMEIFLIKKKRMIYYIGYGFLLYYIGFLNIYLLKVENKIHTIQQNI